jgi:DegV family protein with EDD domain
VSNSGKTAILCDTTVYLPEELLSRHGISLISLYVSLDGEQRKESEITDYGDFYDRLRRSEEGATTSQPSVGDFVAAYTPLLEAGRDVLSIHLSSVISGTYESAEQARRHLIGEGIEEERIEVYDSRSACGGTGMVALAAAAAISRGASPAEAREAAERARERLRMLFSVDTLEYLRKGGRIGAARAWMGSALQIKPILTLEEEITPVERVRTSRRVFERLVEYGRELHEAGSDGWVVQHIQDSERAERLVSECRQIFGSDPLFVSEVGPVIGAHAGPGMLGIGAVPRELVS